MAQEEQIHYSAGDDGSLGFGIISSSGGKSSQRKSKQRRAPQRGLGVAQLEKIRLEEQQQKNAAAILSPPSSLLPGKTSLNLSVSVPNSHPTKQSYNSIPLTSLSPANFMFRSPLPSQNLDESTSSNVTLVAQANNGGFETGWSEVTVFGQGEVPKPWNPQKSNHDEDNSVFDSSLAFRSNFCLTNESNLNWPCTGLEQKKQLYQPSPFAGMDLKFLTEPPSNQSYYGNYTYTTIWPEEERMAGMKRTYPFSLENPPATSLEFRLPMAAPIRSDGSASSGNVGLYSYPVLGEGPSCSSSSSEPNSMKRMKENAFNGDLLTLAPTASTWMCQRSRIKHSSAHTLDSNHEYPDLVSLPFQGGMEVPTFPYPELSPSNQLQPFYRFIPPATAPGGQASPKTVGGSNGEVDESVDLNLKL